MASAMRQIEDGLRHQGPFTSDEAMDDLVRSCNGPETIWRSPVNFCVNNGDGRIIPALMLKEDA